MLTKCQSQNLVQNKNQCGPVDWRYVCKIFFETPYPKKMDDEYLVIIAARTKLLRKVIVKWWKVFMCVSGYSPEKWSGLKLANRTGGYGPVLIIFPPLCDVNTLRNIFHCCFVQWQFLFEPGNQNNDLPKNENAFQCSY